MRTLTYFISDVHLGLDVADPAARERRLVDFLKGIPAEKTATLYLLGDIWDFWYEYRDVVPKGYVRVLSALLDLMDRGVRVCFFEGNHDIWTYHYFEELGMERRTQPYALTIGARRFVIGHGDGLGPGMWGYKLMRWGFHNRVLQALFSTLHPSLAFSLGKGWSRKSRLSRREEYHFRGTDEPIWKFCDRYNRQHADAPADYFIFGHYHCRVDLPVGKARLLLLKDWMDRSNWIRYDAGSDTLEVF